ncbi:hypothetical protein [Thalassovita mediterranea]|jgi:hypothetical protein|nr:hypothetical protein [Thalassovita mediterranea]
MDKSMLKPISDLFRSDEFLPSSAVFPDIDKDRLVKDLDLKKEAASRGAANQPETSAETLDHMELKAVSRVEDLRRRGLENYETNRRVYAERLNKAVSARMLVETEANDSKAKFAEEVTKWKSMMVTPRERVQETYRWRNRFREINKLERPAKEAGSLIALFGLAFLMVILESAGNAYLFAQKNTLGLLGGLMAAFLVSLGNVALSTIFGMASRYINCRGFVNFFKKLVGLGFFLTWLGFALVYNLGVAHFRDAVERNGEWREAGTTAIQTIQSSPFGLYTMESYVLFLLGLFISIISFLKGYNHSDPYPGYSKVAADVVDAREEYVNYLEDSIETLAEHRDDAVNGLRAANDEVHRNINDSVDALYGQKALQSNLNPFLEQCNIAANYILAVYRDSNKAARTDNPPAYFNTSYTFEPFKVPDEEIERRQEAEEQAKEVSELVNTSIQEIFEVFHEAVKAHYEIDELEGTHIDRAARFGTNGKPETINKKETD